MATATTNMNRIPVNVNHDNNNNNNYRASTSTEQKKFTEEYRSTLNDGGTTAYDMRNMNDETERIRNRMREFEEHCRRVREQAFSRTSQIPPPPPPPPPQPTSSSIFNDRDFQFDQRVPLSSFDRSASGFSGSPSKLAPLASSMHRSSIEDTSDGGKKYRLEFDIGDFNQNELYISTNGKTLIIKGDRELKAGSATETKTFNRELTLPEYVDIDKMNAFLLDNVPPKAATSPSQSASFKSSQTQLVAQSNLNNVLVVEAPIILEKYSYRRSAYDKSKSPIRVSNVSASAGAGGYSPGAGSQGTSSSTHQFSTTAATRGSQPNVGLSGSSQTMSESSTSHRTENKMSSTSTSHTKVVRSGSGSNLLNDDVITTTNVYGNNQPISRSTYFSTSQPNLNQSQAPELINGYPIYDNNEKCVVYKFDLSGFDQSEIHLTITADRILEIRACKETFDQLGKIYREFKREIHLEADVDDKLIKNILHEGILTLKIPKANRPDGLGSLTNTHNLNAPNGFREIYTDDGKLSKLTADFRGFSPENVKIVLSANNVIKVTAQQSEMAAPSSKGGSIQRECTRHYTLPAWVQPENMKAIMSRDGILTIDFNLKSSPSAAGEHINIS